MSKYSHDHDCPFEAFITNLGKYNEGDLVGEWVKFPTSPEELEAVFKRIGIGTTDEFGQPYEEWFITDYDMYVEGLYDKLGEYENLDELNYLANVIEEMDDFDYEKFCAAVETGEYTSSVKDIINLASDLDAYEYTPAENDYDLGYYYIEEMGAYDTSALGNLANYIDYERFGRDVRLEQGGIFAQQGYIALVGSVAEYYNGLSEDIPDEYKIMTAGGEIEPEKEEAINNKVYGYVYEDNGMHGDKIPFEGTPENMANFIMYNKEHATVITDTLDQFVVSSTVGGFLDRVAYPALREEILKEILPLQMGEKEAFDVTKGNVERDPISELAKDLDDFAYDYDFYGYQDAIDDRTEHIESLKADLESGNIEGLTDYLKELIEDGSYMVPEATALLGRIEAIVPEHSKEEVKENHLKNAEELLEDDYGMIDGIINNGPKEEEKPSIIEEIKAAKKEAAEKKPEIKEKHHDKSHGQEL